MKSPISKFTKTIKEVKILLDGGTKHIP